MTAAPAEQSRAASTIVNRAEASFTMGGAEQTAGSNDATVQVAEELGIGLVAASGTIAVRAGVLTPAPFVLTNAGNGQEAFVIDGKITGFVGTVTGFAIDVDGDGRYDPSVDTRFDVGGATPQLAPGASLKLLALIQSSAPQPAGTLDIAGRASTGSGRPGTLFAGQGDGGVDAVVGPTTAAASLSIPLALGADAVTVTLAKSQQVVAQDGSDRPTHGATITYTIDAQIAGAGSAGGAIVADPFPDGTDYIPGSMTLDGTALSDATDGDAGTITASGVQISLGDVVAPATRIIGFKVKIR
ncbi:hypothetical protein [Sphingomonas abietis]|uniref:DUF11 domain-containing protein n=1 Tax=Sphingomonas abietis TaxID=3012344 RepID=A0ABY7NP50_9SPHN|nr:hypothetical protein [Sphingomonas abietis]WBO23148.1 hypothetical protein PBT88_03130 [Sphingomonas abietis]